jgi:hypothetical protein
MEGLFDTPPPRGALAVIAVGLFATFAAAVLQTDKPLGSAELEWEEKRPLPDSKRAPIPGGGSIQIEDAGLRATELNAGGYRLYRVAAVVTIAAGSATGQGRLRCATNVPRSRTLIAHTPKSRGAFPRPSEDKDLRKQGDVPEQIELEFSSHGGEFAVVELGDAFRQYTTLPGVVASWAEYEVGKQEWQWGLPSGRPQEPLELGFASFWRTGGAPAARITCTIENSSGSATVETEGEISGLAPGELGGDE